MGRSKDPMRKRTRMEAARTVPERTGRPRSSFAPAPPPAKPKWTPPPVIIPSKGTRVQRIKGKRMAAKMGGIPRVQA